MTFNFGVQKLDFLISLYIFCIIISELMGGKTFAILQIGNFALNASVAIFVIPLLFSVNDVITEVYGAQRTRSIIRSGLAIIVGLILFSILAVWLPPSARFSGSETAYDSVFKVSIRIAISSLIAFATADFMDVLIFSRLRDRLGQQKLWLRNNLSNIISEFFDTAIFIVLAFYTLNKSFGDNLGFLTSLILPYWGLKCFMSVIETPLVYIGVKWLNQKGGEA